MSSDRKAAVWIGNAIYFAGILAAMGASVTKIAAYHGPFQKW